MIDASVIERLNEDGTMTIGTREEMMKLWKREIAEHIRVVREAGIADGKIADLQMLREQGVSDETIASWESL